ncbi:MAG: DNA-processing protein DprA [Eubacteriales bacterium]|nr:DNA-processing protein DprA [Eubacteriales bacterium]
MIGDELAAAMHLTACQRDNRIHHRVFRTLTDQFQTASALIETPQQDLRAILLGILQDFGEEHNQHQFLANQKAIEPFLAGIKNQVRYQEKREQAMRVESFEIFPLLSGSPRYPYRLKNVDSAPSVLYARGRQLDRLLAQPLWVTVVGTRIPTLYGQLVTEAITRDLAIQGVVIVSGLARGIDTLAHEVALEHAGLTVAVISCGLDLVYPPENKHLLERIVEQGVVFSEHPPGVQALRQYFPARNRLLSGLADAIAVMEAAEKSGTLITADFASEQNRDVLAVPGNILDRASVGCHQLIRDGAKLLETAQDIFDLFPKQNLLQLAIPTSVQDGQIAFDRMRLTTEQQRFLQALRGQTLSINQLVQYLKLPISQVIHIISFLEMNRLVAENRGRYALTAIGHCSI